MRFNLIDVLIGVALMSIGTLLTLFILGPEPRRYVLPLGLLAGLGGYFVLSPLIYRRFRIRPMWFPKCPACKDKNHWFRFVERKPDWPRDRIVCSACRAKLELWYEPPKDEDVSTTAPSFELLWPQSWGRWRPIVRRSNA
jgi:hypothetical protein